MMNYKTRIEKVIDHIGQNLDKELSLDELCKVACFSKYHFHRLFTAYIGVSLHAYIKWLRLKRAAHQLVMQKEALIIDIALDAGFESHQSFSRAFKQICKLSPSMFRVQPDWHVWEKHPHSLLVNHQGRNIMTIEIKSQPAIRLAVIEHHGDPMALSKTVEKLITWAKAQPIDLKPKAGHAFGIGYHDPREVPPEEFRFDLALKVPEKFKLNGEVAERILPAGRYAMTTHKGSRDNLGDTVCKLYREWLPETNEELADHPCVFSYINFDDEVAETELLTDIWVLLK